MPISPDLHFADPSTILVIRSERQRTKIEVDDLADSISQRGQLHPIIVTQETFPDEDGVLKHKLCAGERRLEACRKLGIQVALRYYETLSPIEAQLIEYEENLKRKDLPWQDEINAIGALHSLHKTLDPAWTQDKTAQSIGISPETISQMLQVHSQMDNPRVKDSTGWRGAYQTITRANSRQAAVAMTELLEESRETFAKVSTPTGKAMPPPPPPEPIHVESIIVGDFLTWAPTYTGPKFNLLHCDFPYGMNVFAGPQGRMSQEGLYEDRPEVYWELLDCLVSNVDRFLSHSAHVVFWFGMSQEDYYEKTKAILGKIFTVNWLPLVWVKSDNVGVAPDPRRGPRQIYETALLCHRGDRPIVKIMANATAKPTDKSIHPSAKPEPVLKHFFEMLVDGTTRLLDPTAGGGSALRAAEAFGAEFVFGLDIDPVHVKNANDEIRKSRVLREISR